MNIFRICSITRLVYSSFSYVEGFRITGSLHLLCKGFMSHSPLDVLEMVDNAQWDQLAAYVASDAWSELQLLARVQQVLELS